jgi:hypothetical protein
MSLYKDKELFNSNFKGVLNYSYYLHYQEMYKRNVMIMDECHNILNRLSDFYTINFIRSEYSALRELFTKFLGSEVDLFKLVLSIESMFDSTDMKSFIPRLSVVEDEFITKLPIILSSIKSHISEYKKVPASFIPYTKILNKWIGYIHVYEKILFYYMSDPNKWHTEFLPDGNKRAKTLASNFGNPFTSDYNIYMSSTICGHKEFAESLSIKDYLYITRESPFPINNRKVYLFNLEGLNYKNTTRLVSQYAKVMDMIINKHANDRGIIHTVSYALANLLYSHSSCKSRLYLLKGIDVHSLESIMYTVPNRVILSPSLLEGIDLKDELSRFQIFPKVPFLNLGDEWVSKKKTLDPVWYVRDSIIKLVQGSGRSIRGPDDFCVTYILDGNFNKRLSQYTDLIPEWYLKSIYQL